jgi:putative ABC transport system substrate-binding protein
MGFAALNPSYDRSYRIREHRMRRREFIALMAACAAGAPSAALAQVNRMPRIGILVLGTPDPKPFLQQFGEALRELGYSEGTNVTLEVRNAGGSPARLAVLARELAALDVDVIVAFQTPAVAAAKAATATIPIVMCPAQEPVRMGFVASFARPGGNITGVTTATADLAAKNLDLVREALPAVRRIGVLGNPGDPFHKPFLESIEAAAQKLGFSLKTILTPPDQLEAAFAALVKEHVEAVVIQPSLPREPACAIALKYHLPLLAPSAEFAVAGALMAYSADPASVYRDGATFADKILKGRKPADLPVQLATKFLLVINLKTANALGLTLPPTLLVRADTVVE